MGVEFHKNPVKNKIKEGLSSGLRKISPPSCPFNRNKYKNLTGEGSGLRKNFAPFWLFTSTEINITLT